MGRMMDRRSGAEYPLAGRMLVGRAPQCPIRLLEGFVSREHAIIEHRDGKYWIKDLSPNGLWVKGKRVGAGESVALSLGSRVTFLAHSSSPALELVEEEAPRLVAHEINAGTLVSAKPGSLLRLPAPPDEGCTAQLEIACEKTGAFVLGKSARALGHGDILNIGSGSWMMHLPCDETRTASLASLPIDLGACMLRLTTDTGGDSVVVSLHSESSESGAIAEGERLVISRSRYADTLLVLAEKKRKDLDSGVPEHCAGWVTNDELRTLLGCRSGEDENLPYLHPFRIKRLFEAANVRGLEPLFERHAGAIRLGVPRFEITVQ